MSAVDKLKDLTAQMHLEPAEEALCSHGVRPERPAGMIHDAAMPGGKRIWLLKTLLTSACERNCYYCPFRAGRDYRRTTSSPDEMASTFNLLHQKRQVEGLFLSSGIAGGGVRTQDKLLDTAEILRTKFQFRGYLHLKIMPGAEKAQVFRAMQLADRVSVNLEALNTRRLQDLAPRKQFFDELLEPLKWIEDIRRTRSPESSWNKRWPSSVTQFVVGAVGESDVELLQTSEYLYHQLNLRRTYFSAFNPITDTPLENLPPTPPIREHRLYQASFLLRDYHFGMEELPFDTLGNLPHHTDPKLAWAQTYLKENPVEINQAELQELLRIPGIGVKGAKRIIKHRQRLKFSSVADLRRIGINPKRAEPFILLNGHRPKQQLSLW